VDDCEWVWECECTTVNSESGANGKGG